MVLQATDRRLPKKVAQQLANYDRFKLAFDEFMNAGLMATKVKAPETQQRFAKARRELISAREALDG